MDLGLKGKIALVTGASHGLGYATARQLLTEEALVAINSRNEAILEKAADSLSSLSKLKVLPISGNVASAGTAEQIIQKVVEEFGGLDILVCNAGGPPAGSFLAFNDEAWFNAFELSFMSAVRLIRAAYPHLKNSSTPAVLTITSISVKQPIPNLILSNSIRNATIGLTKSLALEMAQEGIRFNSILPGWTETERVTNLMRHRAETKGTDIQTELALQASESPLGRLCSPEEFANAAVFMVSPAASYITGVMLPVDGGTYKATY